MLAVLALAGCSSPQPAEDTSTEPAAAAAPEPEQRVLTEAFLSTMAPEDNIDSVATWMTPDGATWAIATAKSTDRLVVYDGDSGATLSTFGERGEGPGQFRRPNGIAVADDLAFVVERDNHRVQVLRLPAFEHVATFGADDLVKPYGLWVMPGDGGYVLYVTDAYMAGEDADGEDILPPLEELDRRVKRYELRREGEGYHARLAGTFGDTSPEGALRVVESIWGDAENDRLLIAEEDERYANEFKVYSLDGRYSGQRLGGERFSAQAEGIALARCAGGEGWWITTEQARDATVFHLFDRRTLDYTGGFVGGTVANTDGIWLEQRATQRFPQGALYAVHDDQGLVAFDWRDVASALDLPACEVAP